MTGRNLYQAFLMVMCVGSGVMGHLTGANSSLAAFPPWAQRIWLTGLFIGGVTALVGIGLHNLTGLLIERAALLLLAGLCIGYTATAVIVCLIHEGPSAYTTTLVFLFALLNLNRVWQVRQEKTVTSQRMAVLAQVQEGRS